MKNRAYTVLWMAGISAVLAGGRVLAGAAVETDAVDAVLAVEEEANRALNGILSATNKSTRGEAPAKAVAEPANEVVALIAELRKKDQELRIAHAETSRLKGLMRRMLEANRRERVTLLYNLAGVYRAAGEYAKAEANYLKALEINPNETAVHFNLALLYDDDLKNKAKAREHYKRFLDLAPDDKDAPKVLEWLASLE